ncbi:MAG: sugar nucleotide-binding protein, partial [Collinsella intestinalis]
MALEFEKELTAAETNIPGMLVFDLPVHGDSRGWFKENWQREKMRALGLPDMGPVQNNISFNDRKGVTRGIHAEPWDKFISVACGRVFGAWVDLRPGASFGEVYTCELDPSRAIYVPRGVGNSYQALEDGTAYTYLVNAHWSAELKSTYTFVNLADPGLGIEWPIPLDQCELSEADKAHPVLADALPMAPRRTLVTGCNGQLGRAVRAAAEERGLPGFDYCDIDEFDLSRPGDYAKYDWSLYGAVINCGAYTAVDAAETAQGRKACWAANAAGPALMARTCAEHGMTLVHVSSDYVFDGAVGNHPEGEPLSPLSVSGQSKAAGDLAWPAARATTSSAAPGSSATAALRQDDEVPLRPRGRASDALERVTVVDDQLGRLTFTDQMAEGILHLLGYRDGDVEPSAPAEYGPYNLTGSGPVESWAAIAARVFDIANGNGAAVEPVSTADYYAAAEGPIAPRPEHSDLDLSKIAAAGFSPRDWTEELAEYMA